MVDKLSISGLSFFDHEDFDFAKNSDVENEEEDIKANHISIALLSNNAYAGQSLNGIVNLYIENKLPRGHIKLIVKTKMKIKIKEGLENHTIDTIITKFKTKLKAKEKKPNLIINKLKQLQQGHSMKNSTEFIGNRAAEIIKTRQFRNGISTKRAASLPRNENSEHRQLSFKQELENSENGTRTKTPIKMQSFVNKFKRVTSNKVGSITERLGHEIETQKAKKKHHFIAPKIKFKEDIGESEAYISDSATLMKRKIKLSRIRSLGESSKFSTPSPHVKYLNYEILIGSQMMDLFTLKSAIKEKTILCVPFSLKIPGNFLVSYNQNLDLNYKSNNEIKSLELKRSQILNNRKDVNYSGFMRRNIQKTINRVRGNKIFNKKKDDARRYGQDGNKTARAHRIPTQKEIIEPSTLTNTNLQIIKEEQFEQVSVEHSIIAVFVNSEDAKVKLDQNYSEEESFSEFGEFLSQKNDKETLQKIENLADMKAEDQFEVYQKMSSCDFKKFYLKSVVPIDLGFKCANFFKCKWFKHEEFLFPVKISLDRLAFRHSDNCINMVVQYPNLLMQRFRFIDIILVSRYVVKKTEQSSRGSPKKKKVFSKFFNWGKKSENPSEKQQEGATKAFNTENSIHMKEPGMILGSDRKQEAQENISQSSKVLRLQKSGYKGNKNLSQNPEFQAYKKKFIRFIGKQKTRKIDSKKVVIGTFNDIPNDDPPPVIDNQNKQKAFARFRKRSGSMLLPSSKSNSLDTNMQDNIKNKKEYYNYLKKNYTIIDQIVYSTSKNMVGKRNLDKTLNSNRFNPQELKNKLKFSDEECTELVHRISLSDIKVKLESVETDKVSIDYSLMFYISGQPLGFKQFIGEIYLTFISYPGQIKLAEDQKRQKLATVENKIEQNENGFMLPHAHVRIDEAKF